MTVRALAGLLALNLLLLLAGSCLVWAARAPRTWLELVRLAGLGYLCAIAASGAIWTLALSAGIPFSLALVCGSILSVGASGLAIGRRLGRRLPQLASPSGRSTWTIVAGAVGLAAVGVFLEGLFRAARLSGLFEWDAWSFWIPKAKALYYFGEFGERFLANATAPSYPPLIPLLDAAAFHFMGGPDVVTLHVQYWFLTVGFVVAVAGVLSFRVPAWLYLPFLALVLVAPRTTEKLLTPQADFPLDFLFASAALLVLFWLLDGERAWLVLATILLAGTVVTKREGVLLAACLLGAAALASVRDVRGRWPALGVVAVVIAAVALPWRLWYSAHDLPAEAPLAIAGTDRLWPSLRLAVDVFFDPNLWSVIGPLAAVAVLLALLARAWIAGAFAGILMLLVLLGGAWITWIFADIPVTAEESVNPIVRYIAAAVLLAGVATPVLLAEAWRQSGDRASPPRRPAGLLVPLAAAGVALAMIASPLTAVAGGRPRFPSRADCALPPVPGKPVELVFGTFDHPDAAAAQASKALGFGFVQIGVVPDGCGRWEAAVTGYETVEAARGAQAEAAAVGFATRLEQSGP